MASSSHFLLQKLLTTNIYIGYFRQLTVCSSLLAIPVVITDSHTSSLQKSLSSSKPLLYFYMDKNLPCSHQKSIQTRAWVSSRQVNLSLKNYFFYFVVEGKICWFFFYQIHPWNYLHFFLWTGFFLPISAKIKDMHIKHRPLLFSL